MNAMLMQCKVEVLRIYRNPYFVFWTLVTPIIFYFIYTNVMNTDLPNMEQWQAYFLISMTVFGVMGSAIMTFGIRMVQERTEGWSTFMRITPFSSFAYFSAKIIGQTVIHLGVIVVIFLAGFLINAVSLTFTQWFTAGLWILLASIPFLAIGTLVGTMKKVETASGVSNVIYLALAILGGLWSPLSTFPSFLQDFGTFLPSYHFASGAWEIVQGNYPNWLSVLILCGYFVVFMLLSIYIRRKQKAV